MKEIVFDISLKSQILCRFHWDYLFDCISIAHEYSHTSQHAFLTT